MNTINKRIEFISDLYGGQRFLGKALDYNSDSDMSKFKNGSRRFSVDTIKRFEKHGFNAFWFKDGVGYPWVDNEAGELIKDFINSRTDYFTKQKPEQSKLKLYEEKIKDTLKPIEYAEFIKFNSGAAAGIGTPFSDGEDKISLPKMLAKKVEDQFVIEAAGDSMIPLIEPSDVLICEKCTAPKPNQLVVCMLNGDIFVKYYMEIFRECYLRSVNKEYPEIIIKEEDEIVFFGIVKRIIRDVNNLKM